LKVWDTATGGLLRTINEAGRNIEKIGIAFDGRTVLTYAHEGLKIWDAKSWIPRQTFGGYSNAIAIFPDGRHVLSANREIKLWDAGGGRLLRSFDGHMHIVESMAVSPDGDRVLSGGRDGTSVVWSATSGDEIVKLLAGADSVWLSLI